MGSLQLITDMTGTASPVDLNAQNISNVIDEFNRSQDLLDALNTTPKIISKGSGTITWDGTSFKFPSFVTTINAGTQFIFLGYYSRSDLPNNLYSVPDLVIDGLGNVIYEMQAFTVGNQLQFDLSTYAAASPITFTVYYFILQQPANIVAS
jgi:hypothetical protein